MDRLTEPKIVMLDGNKLRENASELYYALKAYEDTGLSPAEIMGLKTKLENRTLVELPCKVGDYVWIIKNNQSNEGQVISVTGKMRNGYFNIYARVGYTFIGKNGTCYYSRGAYGASSFGKTVFLTIEAAEKKLKEGVE